MQLQASLHFCQCLLKHLPVMAVVRAVTVLQCESSFRSSDAGILTALEVVNKTSGETAFSYCGPRLWKALCKLYLRL